MWMEGEEIKMDYIDWTDVCNKLKEYTHNLWPTKYKRDPWESLNYEYKY